MNEQCGTSSVTDDGFEEKELMEILNGMDDDLIDRKICELLAEKGEHADIDSIKKKSFGKLERGKRRRGILKKAFVVMALAATVSTVYASGIRKALETFLGKSAVYQTVVDGEAYYLPAEIPLGDSFMLKYADMSEGTLSMRIKALSAEVSDKFYRSIDIYVTEPGGEEKYIDGGYSINNGELDLHLYNLPMLREFELSLYGETYQISLEKAGRLEVDESLAIGVPQSDSGGAPSLIANLAAGRTDNGAGVGIKLAVGFEDHDLKLSKFLGLGWDDNKSELRRKFINAGNSVIISGNNQASNPLAAIDGDGGVYELKEPQNAVGHPVTVFETDAAPGTALIIEIPAIEAHYKKAVDSITLVIPDEGEVIIDEEIDFIIQKAVVKSVKRTSDITAEILFELNTGVDKTVRISDISAYSKDIQQGDTKITGDAAVLTLTFDAKIREAEIEFSWPYFIIEGNWKITL